MRAMLQLDLWIGEASAISRPPTSPVPDNATSSPASADGPTPSGKPASATTPTSGPDPVRVSRSRARASSAAPPTSATSGRPGTGSSASAALQSSLASKLRASLHSRGSTMFSLTWRERVTPAQRSISQLLASAHRTSDSASIGWPTPTVSRGDYSRRNGNPEEPTLKLAGTAKLALVPAGYPTPRASDGAKGSTGQYRRKNTGEDLPTIAGRSDLTMSSWATPTATDGKIASKPGQRRNSLGDPAAWPVDGRRGVGLNTLADRTLPAAPWATPVATEIRNTLENYQAMKANMKDGARTAITHPSLQAQLAVSGEAPTGSHAPTGKRAQLNPELSRWLQGYPAAWGSCADTVTPLLLKTLSRSSAPRTKRSKKPSPTPTDETT